MLGCGSTCLTPAASFPDLNHRYTRQRREAPAAHLLALTLRFQARVFKVSVVTGVWRSYHEAVISLSVLTGDAPGP